MARISRALDRLKQDLQEHLPDQSILAAAQAAGHDWRERKLGPVATVQLFMLQTLWFNTAIEHLRHLAGFPFAAAAYCKARMRLPLAVLQQFNPSVEKDVYDALSLRGSLNARNILGGTAPAQVRAQIARHRARLA